MSGRALVMWSEYKKLRMRRLSSKASKERGKHDYKDQLDIQLVDEDTEAFHAFRRKEKKLTGLFLCSDKYSLYSVWICNGDYNCSISSLPGNMPPYLCCEYIAGCCTPGAESSAPVFLFFTCRQQNCEHDEGTYDISISLSAYGQCQCCADTLLSGMVKA